MRRLVSSGLGLAVLGLVGLMPSAASAHAYVMSPPSRDVGVTDLNARAHKSGPCGGSPRIGSPTKFAPGATVTVKVEETIDHIGCIQVVFSDKNDGNWQVLKQINDPTNAVPMVYNISVTLPTAKCDACTLAMRQIMYGTACPGNPQDPALSPGGTYYSCSDICIGAAGDPCTDAPKADAGVDGGGTDSGTSSSSSSSSGGTKDSGASSSSSSGSSGDTSSSSSSSSGGRPVRTTDSGGCDQSGGDGSPLSMSLAAVLGFVGLAFVRRRAKRD